ncbi:S-layer homology domain-containing protein [Paenibacillus lautus]|uniref:S-layer homology domain-containing protein n=1 Tax=Paenibacillus lautus TaxID=1401 RepID=UPI003D27E0B5
MHLPKNKIWKKQLMMLLIFVLAAGSFSSALAPRSAAAAGDPAAPGGVGSNLVLWLRADDAAADANNQLTGWADKSVSPVNFTLNVPSGQEARTPKINASGVNFNPSVKFNNPPSSSHYGASAKLVGDKNITFQSGYAVYKWPESGDAGALIGSTTTKDYGALILGGSEKLFAVGTGGNSIWRKFGVPDRSRYQIAGYEIQNATKHIGRVDGKEVPVGRNNPFGEFAFTPVVGATPGSTMNWYGLRADVAEIILYSGETSVDAAKIESYLALKYGITLNGGKSDYIASDGTTKMWTAVDNSGYGNRITGIGKDAASGLEQTQSLSQEAGALVTIALGDQIAASNKDNKNAIPNDKSFLTFSDNGGTGQYTKLITDTSSFPKGLNETTKLMDRVFKVQKSNWKDANITLQLDNEPAEDYKLFLLISADDKFGPEDELIALDATNKATFNSAKLANGSHFTFVKFVDKKPLQEKIAEEAALKEADYSKDSWEAYQKELADAKKVLNNPDATQKEVNEALDKLAEAQNKLAADKTELAKKRQEIVDEKLDKEDYSKDSWAALEEAMKQAETVLNDPKATQTEVDEMLEKLTEARDGLKTDKTELEKTVNELEQIIDSGELNKGDYTSESVEIFDDALKHAKEVLGNPNATQREIDNANKELKEAYDNLVTKDAILEKLELKVFDAQGGKEIKLEPPFDGHRYLNYQATVTESVYSAELSFEELHPESEVNVTFHGKEVKKWDDLPLQPGPNEIIVTVDFEGKKNTYTVIIYKTDKTKLRELVNQIEDDKGTGTLKEEDYTPESWKKFEDSLTAAEEVLKDPDATQEEVDAAEKALQEAYDGLVKIPVDKSELQQKVDEIKDEQKDGSLKESDYTPESWKKLEDALTAAEEVLKNPDATQKEVDDAKKALEEARNGLKEKEAEVDKSELQQKVDEINGKQKDGSLKESDYTPESWKKLDDALKAAEEVLKKPDATQKEVDDAKKALEDAYKNLERVSTGGGNNGWWPPVTVPNPSQPSDIKTTVNGEQGSFATGSTKKDGDNEFTVVEVDKGKLDDILSQGNNQKLVIQVPGDKDVEVKGLTAADVKKLANTGSTLTIEDELLAIYPVPAKQLDLDAIAKQWNGAELKDIALDITIKRAPQALADSARKEAAAKGYELLVNPVDLDLTFSKDGKTVRAGQLDKYAVKYIALPKDIDPNRITTGVVVNPDGTTFHLPTVVTKINDRYFAQINDLRTSGTYSVIWNPQDFDDVKKHWAQSNVNNIAARLQLKGTGNNTFSPNRNVNRSEFAEIVTLGMGFMRQDVPQNMFSDVSQAKWYHNAVTIAHEFDIVRGYTDGLFRGEREITREQGIAMIARAYRFAATPKAMSQAEIATTLASFADAAKVSNWAKESVAQMVAAGIIEGKGANLLNPQASMTRAEATALIERVLKTTGLIDK